eukprot:166170_1
MSETETWTCDLCGLEMKDNKGGIQKHKGSLKCQQRQQKSSNDNGGSIHRGSITNYFKPKQNSNTVVDKTTNQAKRQRRTKKKQKKNKNKNKNKNK